MLFMTQEEYRALLQKTGKGSPVSARKPVKYRNLRVYVYEDGYVSSQKSDSHGALKERYDSVKEYERYKELVLLQKAGAISELRRQVPFELQAAFTDASGKRHRKIVYTADAVYINKEGQEVVEDVKAQDKNGRYRCTEAFRIKWKLLQAKYPDKTFQLY